VQLKQEILPRGSLSATSKAQPRRDQWEVDKHARKRLYDGGGPACTGEVTRVFLDQRGGGGEGSRTGVGVSNMARLAFATVSWVRYRRPYCSIYTGIVLRKLRWAGWAEWIFPEQAQTEFRGRKYLVLNWGKWAGYGLGPLCRNGILGVRPVWSRRGRGVGKGTRRGISENGNCGVCLPTKVPQSVMHRRHRP
jgi:hypothetical protein